MLNPVAALHAITAPRSRSTHVLLSRTSETSGRYVIDFNRPVEITGVIATVIQASTVGGLLVPDREDLLVDISVNEGKRYTSTPKGADVAQSSSYADLRAVDYQAPRVISIPLGGAGELGFELRWKRFTAGAPIYEDALVSLTACYRHVSAAELEELFRALRDD